MLKRTESGYETRACRLKVAISNGKPLNKLQRLPIAVRFTLQIDYIASKAVSAIVKKKKGITMDYKAEIIRMITEMTDEDVLCRIYHFIIVKYRKFKGWG